MVRNSTILPARHRKSCNSVLKYTSKASFVLFLRSVLFHCFLGKQVSFEYFLVLSYRFVVRVSKLQIRFVCTAPNSESHSSIKTVSFPTNFYLCHAEYKTFKGEGQGYAHDKSYASLVLIIAIGTIHKLKYASRISLFFL